LQDRCVFGQLAVPSSSEGLITTDLENDGKIRHAQQIANHGSPGTIRLYDRTNNAISLDEIEQTMDEPPMLAVASKTPVPCGLYTIRPFRDRDAPEVGELIADTYSRFNLSFAAPDELAKLLGPFQHARSPEPVHRDAIAQVLRSPMVYVAEGGGEIVGVLRGRKERLASLFVRADHQRRGIGRRLVERFEQESIRQGVDVIRVAATLYAIPFYTALGYRKTTGIRNGWSFQGQGLRYQPMKKVLARSGTGG
jgi:putative acetyltransferase